MHFNAANLINVKLMLLKNVSGQGFACFEMCIRDREYIMSLTELFVIAVGLSMDAFAVSVCKGLAMTKMNWKGAFLVGAYFGGFQAFMPFMGYLLGSSFSHYISAYDHWIAFILLAAIGGNMIKEALRLSLIHI